MSEIKPSSAVLPARYVDSNMASKSTKESDEDTLSAKESDGALTAEDSEHEIDSESTIFNDDSSERGLPYIFRVKEEAPDSDEDNRSKQREIPTSDVVIKQEPVSDNEDSTCNPADYQYVVSNVRIKEEKDSCVTDTCDLLTASQEGNEHTNRVLKSSFVQENCGSDHSTPKCNHLDIPQTDADKHPDNELSALDKSKNVNYVSNSPPKVTTERLSSNSDVLSSSGYESETCMEHVKTPIRLTNSDFQTMNKYVNQTPENSPEPSSLSTNCYNSNSNEYENSLNKNEIKNLIDHVISDIPTVNSLNTEEIENDAYLYCSEAENTDISFSLFDSTTSDFSMECLSPVADCDEMDSQNSTVWDGMKTTVNSSCRSPKEKAPIISEDESVARNNVEFQNDKMCHKDARMKPPSEGAVLCTMNAAKDSLPRHLIEYSKHYLNFSKSEIEECLDFVSKKALSNPFTPPLFLCSVGVKITKSEKADIFPTVCAETVNRMPCVKELSSSLCSSESGPAMTIEETSKDNSDHLEIGDQNKCSQLPFTEKEDADDNSDDLSHMVSGVKSFDTVVASKEKTNIECDNFEVCDQNRHVEVPSSENDDGEKSNMDSRSALSEVTSYEAVMTNKEKSYVECHNFKVLDQNRDSEIPSFQTNDDDNSFRFNRLMAEVIRDSSKLNTSSESASYNTDQCVQPATQSIPTLTPAVQNEMPPVIKIKQEKIDSIASTESLISDVEKTSVQSDPKIFSGDGNTLLIPSVEDLQKIIETSALLNNPLPSSVNKSQPLNSPKDVKIKIEPPEIEEITLDGDIQAPSNESVTQPTRNFARVTADDDIKVLIIKKRKNSSYKKTLNRAYNLLTKKKKDNNLQRTLNRLNNRSDCNVNSREIKVKKNRDVPNNNVDVSCKSDTFKTAAHLHGIKSTAFSRSLQNVDDRTAAETISNNMFKGIVVKIENTGDYSTQVDPNDSSKRNEKDNGATGTSSSKRTVYVLDRPDTSLNSYKDEKQNTLKEPPAKKMKNSPAALKENPVFSPTDYLTYNERNNCCKRKSDGETENKKRLKSEERVKTAFPNCEDEGQASASFDRMPHSTVPPRKHTLSYSVVSVPSKSNKMNSSLSDLNVNTGSGTFSNVMCSESSISENNGRKPSRSMNEISSCGVNNQASKQTENNSLKFQTSSSTNTNHFKASVCENNDQNLSQLRNETVPSEANLQQISSDSEKHPSSHVPPIFPDRRGGRLSKHLHESVGKNLMDINDLPTLILQWNANWLLVQRERKKCAPICEATHVKDSYENKLDYYNTYFPLHLLSIWLGISKSWKNCPPCFDSVFENQVEKPTFVKISLAAILDTINFHNWPKREDIVLCNTIKSDGKEENLFGRVCNVMAKDYNPPADSSLKDKASTLRKVKFELFCAELLDVPILAIVKVQILSNMRIALLQNDALQNLNSSMKDIILDPKKYISRWKFIALCSSDALALEKSMKNIFESVTSEAVKITVVDTPTPANGIFAIMQLATDLMKKRTPVLIGLKDKESFLKLASAMKHFNPILAIKKREVNLPEELRSFALEERSAISRDIFKSCHVTLTLLSSVFLGDFTSAFSDQNLTCILHESHLCTETETALLLYYDVKNLVLFGNQEAQTSTHPLLKSYGYDVSLFHRFCRVMSMYASF